MMAYYLIGLALMGMTGFGLCARAELQQVRGRRTNGTH